LTLCAVPAVNAGQQVLTLFDNPFHDNQRLDHAVPVATVSRVGDIITLANARTVQNESGDAFVLGAATMDVTNPSRPRIGFTMTNSTQQPIQLSDVFIEATTMVAEHGEWVRSLNTLEGRAGSPFGTEQLLSGATVTVDMPIPTPYGDSKQDKTWGFVVLVGEYPGPASNRAAWNDWKRTEALLSKAFTALISARTGQSTPMITLSGSRG
jgi:hypothetical protein